MISIPASTLALSSADFGSAALILIGLLAWGTHATLPWHLSRHLSTAIRPGALADGSRAHWWWCRLAPLAWLLGVSALALTLGGDPDRAWEVGIGPLPAGSATTLWLSLGLGSLAGADLLLWLARERMERMGWWLAGGLGAIALGVVSWTHELLRAGGLASAERPGESLGSLLVAAALRAGIALAAADLVLSPPRRRSFWSPLAGLAMVLYVAGLAPELRQLLAAQGDLFTLFAGAGLLLASPLAPPRLRRIAITAGLLFAALGLARVSRLDILLESAWNLGDAFPPPSR